MAKRSVEKGSSKSTPTKKAKTSASGSTAKKPTAPVATLTKEYIAEQSDLISGNLETNAVKVKDLISLYDLFLERLQSEDEEAVLEKHEPTLRLLNVTIFKLFEKLFQSGQLKSSSGNFKDLRVIYELYKFNLLFYIENISAYCSLIIDNLDIYMKLLKLESLNFSTVKDGKRQPYFPNKSYRDLVTSLVKSVNGEVLTDGLHSNIILGEFLNKYYKKYVDLQQYFFLELNLEELEDTERELVFSKVLTVVNQESSILSFEKRTFIKNLPAIATNMNEFKNQFQSKLLTLLSSKLTHAQYKTVLLILHKRVIPYLKTPTSLMDFLTDSYDLGDTLISILALNGLFELIKNYNLDYPNFYQKLYELFDADLFHLKFRSRFLRLTDLFLSSTHLPSALVASFIKKMARLSITASPSAIVAIIPFIYNQLKRHPTVMCVIQNDTKEEYKDPFNNAEKDPLQTNAIDSSLWELETLQSHYHPNVATLAKIFSQPFKKPSYNLEDFLDWTYQSLLDSESSRRLKDEGSALEYEEFQSVLGDYLPGWKW
ncbi:hypothetical protein WICPIJ_005956 [Wickerhamomyces pijperi]|uniref:CCAAT-binding factor domain-containing protein n=1 Tax=Wickerhamomyces pijperi TaxID=599730 RepID=A0A9P8Q2K7_WICPI|nr:hypothetical protein WICPIJ_005956 [Wickerhamomyces pijperi]